MDLLLVLAGAGVGLLVGLTGVGGGSLMTPLLAFLFGYAPTTAVGTDLLFAATTKSVGVWVHGKRGTVDWRVVMLLSLGSLPAAVATILMLKLLAAQGHKTDGVILAVLGAALIVTSVAMLLKKFIHQAGALRRTLWPERFKRFQEPLTVVAGMILGVLVTLTSIGAGALCAVMLVYLYPYRLTTAKLVGTDLAHAIPLTLVAGAGHWAMGNVDFALLGNLLAGSIPAIYLGSRLGTSVPDHWLRPALAAVLLIVGIKLI